MGLGLAMSMVMDISMSLIQCTTIITTVMHAIHHGIDCITGNIGIMVVVSNENPTLSPSALPMLHDRSLPRISVLPNLTFGPFKIPSIRNSLFGCMLWSLLWIDSLLSKRCLDLEQMEKVTRYRHHGLPIYAGWRELSVEHHIYPRKGSDISPPSSIRHFTDDQAQSTPNGFNSLLSGVVYPPAGHVRTGCLPLAPLNGFNGFNGSVPMSSRLNQCQSGSSARLHSKT
jgi:hypothetical protein